VKQKHLRPLFFEDLNIDLKCLNPQKIEVSNASASQKILLIQGIDRDIAKKITQLVKRSKLKIQAQVQGDIVRVSGKKRDDLQTIIAKIKAEKIEIPLQFVNFRD
jgi:hypothetical protein